jgi:integrase
LLGPQPGFRKSLEPSRGRPFSLGQSSAARSPQRRTSTHIVPLSDLALETIRSMPRVHDHLVFPARGKDNPVSGYSKWKRKLDQISGVRDWTLHDLRRSAATGMAQLKVPLHVIELVLNHRSKSLRGVAGVY